MPKRRKSRVSNRQNQAAYRRKLAELKKQRRAAKREIDKEYRQKLRELKRIGAYKARGTALTKSRKRIIRKQFAKFEEYLFSDRYIHIPLLTRKRHRKRKALKQARQNKIPTTPKGVFIERTRNTKKATARFNKMTGNYDIVIRSKKKGKRGAKETTEIVPIAPMGALDAELARIKADAISLGPLKENETIAFKVRVNGNEGFSHNIYDDPEALVRDIAIRYDDMKMPFKQQFFASISVVKTKRLRWLKQHPVKSGNPYAARPKDKTGRSIPIKRTKKKITVRKVKEGWAVYIGPLQDSIWPTRNKAEKEAAILRKILNR